MLLQEPKSASFTLSVCGQGEGREEVRGEGRKEEVRGEGRKEEVRGRGGRRR